MTRFRCALAVAAAVASLPSAATPSEVTRYSYDALGRLIAVDSRKNTGVGATTNYQYDAASNRKATQRCTVAVTSVLRPGDCLLMGDGMVSDDGQYVLNLQYDGNLVLYNISSGALWATSTFNGARLYMQPDGNLVLYDNSGRAIWSTGTAGHGDNFVALQPDGNLVVYSQATGALWSRFEH